MASCRFYALLVGLIDVWAQKNPVCIGHGLRLNSGARAAPFSTEKEIDGQKLSAKCRDIVGELSAKCREGLILIFRYLRILKNKKSPIMGLNLFYLLSSGGLGKYCQ